MSPFIFFVLAFIFGLIIGSFLNVVIYRINTRKSLHGRSACMSCQNQLLWYELIPVFSFLGLKGRCRNCKTKISIQYPLVELSTGLIFAMLFLKFQDTLFLLGPIFIIIYLYYAFMFSLLLVIAVYDLKHKIVPDVLAFIFGILAFIGMFLFRGQIDHLPSLLEFLSGPLIALPFALFWLVSRGRWMGLGDAKLALGLGWFLGISVAISGAVVAFWSGALVGIYLILFHRNYGMKSEIPFVPYLVFGAFIAFIFDLNLFQIGL